MDHDLLAELGVAPDNGRMAHSGMVGRGGPVDDRGMAMVDRGVLNGVVEGGVVVDGERMDGAMRDDVVMHDPMVMGVVVMDRRRVARLRRRRGRNRERGRRRP